MSDFDLRVCVMPSDRQFEGIYTVVTHVAALANPHVHYDLNELDLDIIQRKYEYLKNILVDTLEEYVPEPDPFAGWVLYSGDIINDLAKSKKE